MWHPRTSMLAAVLAFMGSGCTSLSDLPTERLGEARLSFANGLPAGTVQLLGAGNSLTLAVGLTGVDPGEHGFHLHTTGACAAPDFKSAGGHLNPQNASHGRLSDGGQHFGDLPNIVVGASGTATATFDLQGPNRERMLNWLFDEDGTAIVLHAGPDDYRSDPAGDAGPRVACGVLKRS